MKFLFFSRKIFRAKYFQNFFWKIRLEIFPEKIFDRYAASWQGRWGRLKFSGSGLIIFFSTGGLLIIFGPGPPVPLKPGGWPGLICRGSRVPVSVGYLAIIRNRNGHRTGHVPEILGDVGEPERAPTTPGPDGCAPTGTIGKIGNILSTTLF